MKKKHLSDFILEVIGFVRILASPFLIALAIGLGIYIKFTNDTGLITAMVIAVIGLILGIYWGLRIWKKRGTFNYISKIYETTDGNLTKDS